MGIYSSLVGKRVQVQYRAADVHLSAAGTLVSDSGTSIVLEDHISQGEKDKNIRVEIPYRFVIRVNETREPQSTKQVLPIQSKRKS
ncbi:MAG: hypothetical protein WCD49_15340 [Candidatus Acidiferrales bacterium]